MTLAPSHDALRAGLVPAAPRLPCFDAVHARGYLEMCRLHGIAPGLGGSALDPEHVSFAPPCSSSDAATLAPCRGAL